MTANQIRSNGDANTGGDAVPSPFLRVRNLTKMFGSFTALDDISLDIEEGSFVCFLGPSGCGKTTFLRAIAGLDIQTHGTIEQAGRDISALPPSERDFGIVFQSYALFPNLTVERNVAYGLENTGMAKPKIAEQVDELLKLVGLPDQAKKYPAQLSGGQQQRIALARALAMSPGLLLLDEPLSALDARVRTHLRHEIKDLQAQLGLTTIMVTHDQEEALTMADVIVVMNDGVIEQQGSPQEIYGQPANLFVADFIGEMNHIAAVVAKKGEVQVGDVKLACETDQATAGDAGTLTIRPEDIVPTRPKSKKTKANTLAVTISDMEFLGSYWRAGLSNEALGDTTLFADFSIQDTNRLALDVGEKISVELPAASLRFFAKVKGA